MSALYPIGIGATLCCILAVLLETTAAPFQNEQQPEATGLEPYYTDSSAGCYYNFQHYDEGDRIITNEPCLNCTCHNRMLMCYLRVCPFSKEIGQDCTVEKKLDQCCPEITCPEVPVHLLSEVTTVAPEESTELGHLDTYGCSIDEVFYSDGAQVPSNPHRPCELCYCIRNRTACVMQECTLHVEGCKPVYQEGVCCPARYDCDYDADNLETTVKPTPGLIFTTTLQPGGNTECYHNNEVYADGASIVFGKPCEHCYCMKGEIVCAVQECGTPLENVGKNCTALPTKKDKCCPDLYECVTESPLDIVTTESYLETTPIKDDRLNEVTDSEVQVTESVVQEIEEPVVRDVTEAQETEAVHVTTESVAQETVPMDIDHDHHTPAEIDNELYSEPSTTEYEEKVTETIMIKETRPIDTEHDKLYRVTETIPAEESTQIIEEQITTLLPESNELEDEKQVTDKVSTTSHEESTTLKEDLAENTEHISQEEHTVVTEEQVSVTQEPVPHDVTLITVTTDGIQQVTESNKLPSEAPVEDEKEVQPVEFETTQPIVSTTDKIEELVTETAHDITETIEDIDTHVTETQNKDVTENIQQTTENIKQTTNIETSSVPHGTEPIQVEVTDQTTEHVLVEGTPIDIHDDIMPETTEPSEKNVEEDIPVVTKGVETTEIITELEETVPASEEPEHVDLKKQEPTITEASTTSVDDKIIVADATEVPHFVTTHTPEEQFSETTSTTTVIKEHVEPEDSLTTIAPSIDIVQDTEHPVVITKESTTDVIPTLEDTDANHQEPEKPDENIVVDAQTTSQTEVEKQVTDKIELSTEDTVTTDTLHMITEVQEPSKIETADHMMETTATPLDESQHTVTHTEAQQPEEHLTIGSAITETVTEGIIEEHTTSELQEKEKSAVTDDMSYITSGSVVPTEEVQKETKPVLEQEKIDEQPHMTSPSDVSITTEREEQKHVDVLPLDDGQHVVTSDEQEHQTTSVPTELNVEHEGSGHIETSEQPTDETPAEQSTEAHEEPIKTDTPEYQQVTEAAVSETENPIQSTIDEEQPTEIHMPEPTEVPVLAEPTEDTEIHGSTEDTEIQGSTEAVILEEHKVTETHHFDEQEPTKINVPELQTEMHLDEESSTISQLPQDVTHLIDEHIPTEAQPEEHTTLVQEDIKQTTTAQLPEEPIEIQIPEEQTNLPPEKYTTAAQLSEEQTTMDQQTTTPISEEQQPMKTDIPSLIHQNESLTPDDQQVILAPESDTQQMVETEQTTVASEEQPIESTETTLPEEVPVTKVDQPAEQSSESQTVKEQEITVVPALYETQTVETHIPEEQIPTESRIPQNAQTTVAPKLDEPLIGTHIPEEYVPTEIVTSEISIESHTPEDRQTTIAPRLDDQTLIPEEHGLTETIISEVSTKSHIPEDKQTTVAPRLDDQEPIEVELLEEQSLTEADVLVDVQTTVTSVSDEQPIETHTTDKHMPTDTIVSELQPTTIASLPEEVDQQSISTHLPEEQVPTENQTPETVHTTISTVSEELSTESHIPEEHVSIEDQLTTVSALEKQYPTELHTIDEQYTTAAPVVVEEHAISHIPDKQQTTESQVPDDQETSVIPEKQTIEPMITIPELLFTEEQTTVSSEAQPIDTHTSEEQVPTDANVVEAEQTSEQHSIAGETTTVVPVEDQPIEMNVSVEQLPIETHAPEEHTSTEQLPTETTKTEEHTPTETYEPELHTPSNTHLETQQPIDTHTPEEQMPTDENVVEEEHTSKPQIVVDEEQATASSVSEETPIQTHAPEGEIEPNESNIPIEVPEEQTPIEVHLPQEEPTTEIQQVTESHMPEEHTTIDQETKEPVDHDVQELITTAQPVEYEVTEKEFTQISEEDKLEEHTTLAQEQVISEVTENVSEISDHEIQNTESPELSTHNIKIDTTKVETETATQEIPTTEYILHTSDESTEAVTLKEDGHPTEHVLPESHDVTTATVDYSEIQVTEVSEYLTPEVVTEKEAAPQPVVPGEGSCLVEGQTYENNTLVPSMNPCQTTCSCVSSIVQCESVRCLPPPVNMENCMPIYHSAHSCCPTYACTGTKPTEIESDSHISETTEATTDDKLKEESTSAPLASTTEDEKSVETKTPAVVGHEIEGQKTEEPEEIMTTLKTTMLPVDEEEIPDKDVEIQQTHKPEELPVSVTTVQQENEQTSTISAVVDHVIVTTPQSEDNELTQEKASEEIPVDETTEEIKHVEPSLDETPATTATVPEEPEIKVTTSIPREEEQHTEIALETTEHSVQLEDEINDISTEKQDVAIHLPTTVIPQPDEEIIKSTEDVQVSTVPTETEKISISQEEVTDDTVILEEQPTTPEIQKSEYPENESSVTVAGTTTSDEETKQESIEPDHSVEPPATEHAQVETTTTALENDMQTDDPILATAEPTIALDEGVTTQKAIIENEVYSEPQVTEKHISEIQPETVQSTESVKDVETTTVSIVIDGLQETMQPDDQVNEIDSTTTAHSMEITSITETVEQTKTETPEMQLPEEYPTDNISTSEQTLVTESTHEEVTPEDTVEVTAAPSDETVPVSHVDEVIEPTSTEQPEDVITPKSEDNIHQTEQPQEIITKTSLDIDEYTSKTTTGVHIEQSEITETDTISVTESVIHSEDTMSPESHVTEQSIHVPTHAVEQEQQTTEYVHLEEETEKDEEGILTPPSVHPDAHEEHKSSISETEITKEVDATTKIYESSETPIKESEKPVDTIEEAVTTERNILEIEVSTVSYEKITTQIHSENHSIEDQHIEDEKEHVTTVSYETTTILKEHSTEQLEEEVNIAHTTVQEISHSDADITITPVVDLQNEVTELPLEEGSLTTELEHQVTVTPKTDYPIVHEYSPEPEEETESEKSATTETHSDHEIHLQNEVTELPLEEGSLATELEHQVTVTPQTDYPIVHEYSPEPEEETESEKSATTETHSDHEIHIGSEMPIEPITMELTSEEPITAAYIPVVTEEDVSEYSAQPDDYTTEKLEEHHDVTTDDYTSEKLEQHHDATTESVDIISSTTENQLFTSGAVEFTSKYAHVTGELSTSAPIITEQSTVVDELTKPVETTTPQPQTSTTLANSHHIPDENTPEMPDYTPSDDYEDDHNSFGPGTCRYGGKVYVSAQQIPRDDPCDFCFCFRSDIICLQQSCPPPIPGCHEEPIPGFCCPRYECPVSMAMALNLTTTTTTTTTTLPPHFLSHAYKGAAYRQGCQIQGQAYRVGEVVRSASGPCLHCTCGGDGQMKCDPKNCSPQPMLQQMIAAAAAASRR